MIYSVVPRSRFLGDTSVPLPEFLRDICKFWGTHQFHLIFACKIENSFPEISVHFYLHLSSRMIVLAQEGVQILEVEHHVTGHNNTSAIFDWGYSNSYVY